MALVVWKRLALTNPQLLYNYLHTVDFLEVASKHPNLVVVGFPSILSLTKIKSSIKILPKIFIVTEQATYFLF